MILSIAADLLPIISQSPPSLEGTVDLIQIGFVGVALLWFAMGKVHPDSTVRDLKQQIADREKTIADERADSKAIRDAVIRDVAPTMARLSDRDKELAILVTKLLAWQVSQDGK